MLAIVAPISRLLHARRPRDNKTPAHRNSPYRSGRIRALAVARDRPHAGAQRVADGTMGGMTENKSLPEPYASLVEAISNLEMGGTTGARSPSLRLGLPSRRTVWPRV
jgi:hypothetical protein